MNGAVAQRLRERVVDAAVLIEQRQAAQARRGEDHLEMVAAARAVLDAQLLRVGKRILQQRFEAFDGHTAMLVTVAEAPEELYERASGALRAPDVGKWISWPFAGDVAPRDLLPPIEAEQPRHGAGGAGCRGCLDPEDEFVWTDDRWRIRALPPSGLPLVVILEPRAHVVELDDLGDEGAADLGRMLVRVERAVRSIGHIGRVHVCRWQDGSEHLHWWFMARPVRLPQVRGTFAAIWDDVLPPLPDDVWRANVDAFVAAL